MICQSCGKKTATTHIKTVVNGKLAEYHLCADCAKKLGVQQMEMGSPFGGLSMDFGNLLSGLLGAARPEEKVLRCEKCGATFAEIAKTGKVGCAECYNTFRSQLLPTIQRVHGTTRHKGKTPGGSALRVTEQSGKLVSVQEKPIDEKKRQLQKAIEAQEFERAAVLRDEIKEMESHE